MDRNFKAEEKYWSFLLPFLGNLEEKEQDEMTKFERVATGMGEECGVFGAYSLGGEDVAASVYYGLFALQHRGQESCGIAVTDTSGRNCSDRHVWQKKVSVKEGAGACE